MSLKPPDYKLIIGIDPGRHKSGWAKLYIGEDIRIFAGLHIMPFKKMNYRDDELAREVSNWEYDHLFFEGDFTGSQNPRMDGICKMTESWKVIHPTLNFLNPDQWREILGMEIRGERGRLKRQSVDFVLDLARFYPKVKFYKATINLPHDVCEAVCISVAGAIKLNLFPGVKGNGS